MPPLPAVLGPARTVAVDLDGTLLCTPAGTSFETCIALEGLTPMVAVCHKVRWLLESGWRIVIVTGRTEAVRAITEAQVRRCLRRHAPVIMQSHWRGWEHLVPYKSAALRRLQADAYIGDSVLDRQAAALASVPFLPVAAFAVEALAC